MARKNCIKGRTCSCLAFGGSNPKAEQEPKVSHAVCTLQTCSASFGTSFIYWIPFLKLCKYKYLNCIRTHHPPATRLSHIKTSDFTFYPTHSAFSNAHRNLVLLFFLDLCYRLKQEIRFSTCLDFLSASTPAPSPRSRKIELKNRES